MFDIVGFCSINPKATTCKAENPEEFIGQICAVFEFAADGGVLVLNPQGTALAMFDKKDVWKSFKCNIFNGVVVPHNLNPIEKAAYAMQRITRKGGYNHIVRQMVIVASLHKGVLNDNFLFQKQ